MFEHPYAMRGVMAMVGLSTRTEWQARWAPLTQCRVAVTLGVQSRALNRGTAALIGGPTTRMVNGVARFGVADEALA